MKEDEGQAKLDAKNKELREITEKTEKKKAANKKVKVLVVVVIFPMMLMLNYIYNTILL